MDWSEQGSLFDGKWNTIPTVSVFSESIGLMLYGTETSNQWIGDAWSLSISSAGASPASPSVLRGSGEGERTSGGSGRSLLNALAYYDQDSCSLRMCQGSLYEDSPTCSETWPRAGTMRSGIVCPQAPLAPLTRGIESGWWPTATANNYEMDDLDGYLARRQRCKESNQNGNGFGLTLGMAVKFWPTPTSRDWKDGATDSVQNGTVPVNALLGRAVEPTKMNGSLDPAFVEYLMGYEIGWTDCGD